MVLHHLGEAYLRAGCAEEAQRLAQWALVDICECKMRGWVAWALWLLGEIAAVALALDTLIRSA